jgi:hypothetical protein
MTFRMRYRHYPEKARQELGFSFPDVILIRVAYFLKKFKFFQSVEFANLFCSGIEKTE